MRSGFCVVFAVRGLDWFRALFVSAADPEIKEFKMNSNSEFRFVAARKLITNN